MIVHTLQFLREQINLSFPPGGPSVVLGNISRYNDGDEFNGALQNQILLSVINVEEDRVIRQVEHYKKENNQVLFKNPPLWVNLTLMFASTHTDYMSALLSIESVLLFFQKNAVYNAASSSELQDFNQLNNVNIDRITFEIVNLSLDQLHQLWSGLGGHYMPSIIYKLRILELDAATVVSGEPIMEIQLDTWHKKQVR